LALRLFKERVLFDALSGRIEATVNCEEIRVVWTTERNYRDFWPGCVISA